MVEKNEIEEKVIIDYINDYFYEMRDEEIIVDNFNVEDYLYSTYCIIKINDKYYEVNPYE